MRISSKLFDESDLTDMSTEISITDRHTANAASIISITG